MSLTERLFQLHPRWSIFHSFIMHDVCVCFLQSILLHLQRHHENCADVDYCVWQKVERKLRQQTLFLYLHNILWTALRRWVTWSSSPRCHLSWDLSSKRNILTLVQCECLKITERGWLMINDISPKLFILPGCTSRTSRILSTWLLYAVMWKTHSGESWMQVILTGTRSSETCCHFTWPAPLAATWKTSAHNLNTIMTFNPETEKIGRKGTKKTTVRKVREDENVFCSALASL